MRLTKFTHACVRLDDDGRALVIDPGEFSETATALEGASAVLITHEHFDHLDVEALLAGARANPDMRVWAPAPVVQKLAELGSRATAVDADETFDAAGFSVQTFGGKHAVIHPALGTPCANVGFMVNETVYHPGDSFFVPTVQVDTLLVPLHAPWSKIGEIIDFVVAVRPRRAFPIHDAMLSEPGIKNSVGHVSRFADRYGSELRYLAPGDAIEI
ncbi:MAG TPA: MBL fold metallo-hydrolase [Acidothermaceae bacterium]|nr:MBL fold metallo-hydrolase [Acidothermaceae bacterium]